MAKFYAVRKGLNTGIYTNWDEAEKNVKGFPRCRVQEVFYFKGRLRLYGIYCLNGKN